MPDMPMELNIIMSEIWTVAKHGHMKNPKFKFNMIVINYLI